MSKLIFSFLFALCFLPASIYGCSCAYRDPAGAFNKAQMVFVGRVAGGTEKVTADYDGSKLSSTLVAGQVRFAVENIYKGKSAAEIIVNVSSNIGTSCGPYGLTSGETYVVYAYHDIDDKTKLYTGVCTRTGMITSEYAAEDLKFLRNLPSAGSGGNIRGRIWYDSRERSGGAARPLAGVKITIRNITTKRIFPVVSDKDGNFSLERVAAGKYTVTPQLPVNFYVGESSHTVEVADRGTADTGFEAYYTGSVAGKIVDKNGLGFENMFLHLESMISDPQPKSVYGHGRGKQGAYEFSGVPPGKYRLYFELDHDDYDQKGDRYYYPGTFDPGEAKTIEVKLGEQLRNIDFPLPADYQIRTLSGQVFNKNGTPAAKVEVLLLCPTGLPKNKLRVESSPTTVKTDAFGRFVIQGFAGETYWLEARGEFSEKAGSFEQKASPSKKITLQDNLRNIKLMLSEDESRSCVEERSKSNF